GSLDTDGVRSIAWSPDGQWIASGGSWGEVHALQVWQTNTLARAEPSWRPNSFEPSEPQSRSSDHAFVDAFARQDEEVRRYFLRKSKQDVDNCMPGWTGQYPTDTRYSHIHRQEHILATA